MANSNMNEQIFVKISRPGYIPQLGICGPIPNPIRITRLVAKSLIVSGTKVFQFFPDTGKTVELTLSNVFGDTDGQKDSDESKSKDSAVTAEETPTDNKTEQTQKKQEEPVVLSGVPKTENKVKKDTDNASSVVIDEKVTNETDGSPENQVQPDGDTDGQKDSDESKSKDSAVTAEETPTDNKTEQTQKKQTKKSNRNTKNTKK